MLPNLQYATEPALRYATECGIYYRNCGVLQNLLPNMQHATKPAVLSMLPNLQYATECGIYYRNLQYAAEPATCHRICSMVPNLQHATEPSVCYRICRSFRFFELLSLAKKHPNKFSSMNNVYTCDKCINPSLPFLNKYYFVEVPDKLRPKPNPPTPLLTE